MNLDNSSSNNQHSSNGLLEVCQQITKAAGLPTMAGSHRIYHRRDPLVTAGNEFEGIYVLRSGSAKSFITSPLGDEHITGFYYPGDLIGFDGFDSHVHHQNVCFLETSSVCFVKEAEMNGLLRKSEQFRRCLLKSMSQTLSEDNSMMMCLSTCNSEQRVSRFLLDVSNRFLQRGLSGNEFVLSMTRTDIANYLGMAIETVSRVFANFQQKNIISVKHRHLIILDYKALKQVLQKCEKC